VLGEKTTFIFAFQERAVPRFYFDVREGTRFDPDEEGLEFDSLDTAEREAACTAAEIGRDRLPTGDSREITVEVQNEHRQRVLTIKVSMEVDRVEPSPQPPHWQENRPRISDEPLYGRQQETPLGVDPSGAPRGWTVLAYHGPCTPYREEVSGILLVGFSLGCGCERLCLSTLCCRCS
jgi:hypothetical protein